MDLVKLQREYISKNKEGRAVIEYSSGEYVINVSEFEVENGDIVIGIEEVEYSDEFVYDIETDYGHFQAGVGDIIVHNTDSVFVKFKTPGGDKYKELELDLKNKKVLETKDEVKLKEAKDLAMTEAFAMGERASKEVTEALFKKPNLLEFEKVYMPLLLFGKKMYIAALYEKSPLKPDYIDKKGVALKRRDSCHYMKKTYNYILDLVMENGERGLDESLEYLDLQIDKLARNEIHVDDLIISKTLKSGYKTENIPHKVLAEKMFERDPGSAPRMNERVPFIFVENPNKRAKLYEKVEDPKYAVENGLKPDLMYYLENQLQNPVSQFYGCLIGEEEIAKFFKRKIQQHAIQGVKCEAIYKSGEKKGQRCGQDVKYEDGIPLVVCGRHVPRKKKWLEI
jgi:DNA polymerase elongation subunit (family B)